MVFECDNNFRNTEGAGSDGLFPCRNATDLYSFCLVTDRRGVLSFWKTPEGRFFMRSRVPASREYVYYVVLEDHISYVYAIKFTIPTFRMTWAVSFIDSERFAIEFKNPTRTNYNRRGLQRLLFDSNS